MTDGQTAWMGATGAARKGWRTARCHPPAYRSAPRCSSERAISTRARDEHGTHPHDLPDG
jgi:hypothetical protein